MVFWNMFWQNLWLQFILHLYFNIYKYAWIATKFTYLGIVFGVLMKIMCVPLRLLLLGQTKEFRCITIYESRAWISGWGGGIHTQDLEIPSNRIARAGDSHLENFLLFLQIFAFMKQNSPFLKKNTDFYVMLDNFLVTVLIFYRWSEVIVFRFYWELNTVLPKNSELNCRISHILPFFVKIIVY